MSTTTKRRLNKFADVLEAVARNIVNVIELVVMDAAGGKRSRRARAARVRTPRTYVRRSTYHQPAPVIVVKVVGDGKIDHIEQ